MDACNQAVQSKNFDSKESLTEFLHSAFPTVGYADINVKTIGFAEGSPFCQCIGEKQSIGPQRYYIHPTADCDTYTDGQVFSNKDGKRVIDFTRAFFVERDKRGIPSKLTIVFRADGKREFSKKELIDFLDPSLLSLMV